MQDETKSLGMFVEGECGSWHFMTDPFMVLNRPRPQEPAIEAWTLTTKRFRSRKRTDVSSRPSNAVTRMVHGHFIPANVRRNRPASVKALAEAVIRRKAWQDLLCDAPRSPREYILREIASDNQKYIRGGKSIGYAIFSKRDADRYVFGTHLAKSERQRNYLKEEGVPFDQFIQGCIYDYYGSSNTFALDSWTADTFADHSTEWENELEAIISSVTSSPQAKETLIDDWLKATTSPDEAPAF